MSSTDCQLQRYWHKRRRTWKEENCQWKSSSKKKPTCLWRTYRPLGRYFLDHHFIPSRTSIIFDNYLWENSGKHYYFNPPNFFFFFFSEILLLLCYILKNGAEDSIISFHSEFYFLKNKQKNKLKLVCSARPTCVKSESRIYFMKLLLLQVFNFSFLFIDSKLFFSFWELKSSLIFSCNLFHRFS